MEEEKPVRRRRQKSTVDKAYEWLSFVVYAIFSLYGLWWMFDDDITKIFRW